MFRNKNSSGRRRRADKARAKSLAASQTLRSHLEALEPRLLMSAEPLAGTTSQDAGGRVLAFQQSNSQQRFPDLASAKSDADSAGPTAASPSVVLFIDHSVAGAIELAGSAFDGARVVLLDEAGIVQITSELSRWQDLDSIKIISHGARGTLQIGDITLDTTNVGTYADELAAWGRALFSQPDAGPYVDHRVVPPVEGSWLRPDHDDGGRLHYRTRHARPVDGIDGWYARMYRLRMVHRAA